MLIRAIRIRPASPPHSHLSIPWKIRYFFSTNQPNKKSQQTQKQESNLKPSRQTKIIEDETQIKYQSEMQLKPNFCYIPKKNRNVPKTQFLLDFKTNQKCN